MAKRYLVFATILSTVIIVTAQIRNRSIQFIGYDGQIPLFASNEKVDGLYIGHDGIYQYADGHLTRTNVSIKKGTQCLKVKNGIYVFGYMDSILAKIQFKRNGRELFFERTVTWVAFPNANIVAMNDEAFFTIAKWSDVRGGDSTSMIFRIKYCNLSKIDTIKINGDCVYLLDATNNHLYYIVQYPTDPNDIDYYSPRNGSIYRMNFRDSSIDEIAKDVSTMDAEETAIVPHLNILYSRGRLVDYNKDNKIWSRDKTYYDERIFFSYEHNAFIDYKTFSDIHKWDCYHLAPGGKLPTELRAVPCFKEVKEVK
jgi:hypothetical protein